VRAAAKECANERALHQQQTSCGAMAVASVFKVLHLDVSVLRVGRKHSRVRYMFNVSQSVVLPPTP
jgi:hypothetical protein